MIRFQQEAQAAAGMALLAGRLLRDGFSKTFIISQKSAVVDLVTEFDLASEKLIRNEVARQFPQDLFYGEEGGGADYHQGRVWVVDPLDGTTNFANHLPIFCVSIAFFEEGIPRAGAVYQPMTDELFVTWENGGAFRNGLPIKVTGQHSLEKALGATGFPYHVNDCLERLLGDLKTIMPISQGIRRLGSAAMDLCYVASGIFDFFWEMKLNPWDVAAGGLLVKEAGGKITEYNGGADYVSGGTLLATNGLLHPQLLEILNRHGKKS